MIGRGLDWLGARLAHRTAPVAVALAGAWLALLGTQWPQTRAPVVATDGKTVAELANFAAYGLDHWWSSLPVLLWLALAICVGTARLVREPPAGYQWLYIGLWTLALAALTAIVAVDVVSAEPFWVDLAVPDQPDQPSPPQLADAWQVKAGKLVPKPGLWTGQCRAAGAGLRCTVRGPGVIAHVDWSDGLVTEEGGLAWQWVATLARPAEPVTAVPGAAVAASTVLVPAVAQTTGPLVLAVGTAASQAWVSPQLAKTAGSQSVRHHARAGRSARLLAVDPLAGWQQPLWMLVVAALFAVRFAVGYGRAPLAVLLLLAVAAVLASQGAGQVATTVDAPHWLGQLDLRQIANLSFPTTSLVLHDPLAWALLGLVGSLAALTLPLGGTRPLLWRTPCWVTVAASTLLAVGGHRFGLTVAGLLG